jgi:hypothetical protein
MNLIKKKEQKNSHHNKTSRVLIISIILLFASYLPFFSLQASITTESSTNKIDEKELRTSQNEPTITSSLTILESPNYYRGQIITGQFTIENKGSTTFLFGVLTIGGRDPDDQVADFTFKYNFTLDPGQSYNYQGTLKLMKSGNYHFFCAYKKFDGSWNTAIPTEPGVTNVKDIYVYYNNIPYQPNNLRQFESDGIEITKFYIKNLY